MKLEKENAKKVAAGKKTEKIEKELMPAEVSKTPRTGVHRQPKKLPSKDTLPAVVV